MTDIEKDSLIEFPCDFPIKIIGKHSADFLKDVITILRTHFPDISDEAIQQQESQKGNYISITATPHVPDKASLDALYLDLTKHPDMKMVL